MNCESFHGLLYDYLDETLDAEVQAAARQHLQECDTCRHAFLRERALAKSMGQSLNRATTGLLLRPEIRQNVLKALQSNPAPTNAWVYAWQRFSLNPIRTAGMAAALLGMLLLFFGIQYYRRVAKDLAPKTIAQTGHYTCVVDVPILTQIHVFRQQNNAVMDSIAADMGVAHASLYEAHEEPSPKPSSKPL